ncbi:hypothetical protein BJY00DRAFT_279992 [Aspergillus carlsbadensis]|nr:hypothetical protein BJY00DRAFT_279992 [Aspergillus carlsbadensis]
MELGLSARGREGATAAGFRVKGSCRAWKCCCSHVAQARARPLSAVVSLGVKFDHAWWASILALAIAVSGLEGQDPRARLPRRWFVCSF